METNIAAPNNTTYYAYGTDLKEERPYPPCRAACPVNTDVQGYVSLIAQGRYAEAFEVIHAVNPIASVCSLICHHPCEQECRRNNVDEPLAIRHLKRFALEQVTEYRRSKRKLAPQTREKKIAIIGSGPSGLTVANDLADLGYQVTIFERNKGLGGMLSSAVPTYRLPREALKEDIDDILAKGVEAKTNCEIGKDLMLNDLIKEYNAVLIAVGLSQSRSLNIPGVDDPNVLLALPFLNDVAYGGKPELGNKVLIIGGGNVAIDVARSARRLGRENIEMVCLESAEEMPAWEWEIQEALEEGIKITNRWGPKAVLRSNGRLKGLETVKVKAVFDEAGRFSPTFYDDQTSFIEADTIIITIGQMSNLSFLKNTPVAVDERGRLIWDKNTFMTSAKGVFASGEVITAPGSTINAVANGHRAAKAIHLYLQGEDIRAALISEEKEKIAALPEDVIEKIIKQSREAIELIPVEARCAGFTQFEIGYDEYSALREARRCRSCGAGAIVNEGKCVACLTCLRICPYDAPVVTNKAEMPPDKCQACGLCAPECPGRAISMVGYDINELRDKMPDIIGAVDATRGKPLLVAFQCNHHAGVNGTKPPENIRQIRVHCTSRIDILDLLKVFECGADGAYVIACREEDCKYEKTSPHKTKSMYPPSGGGVGGVSIANRVKKRVEYTKQLISEIGIEGERLGYFESGMHPEAVWRQAAEEMTEKVKVSQV
ncbi:hydrogenase iron-sulfur subunit [Candidatus Poribacteria bacterium]|nr:hydrogenase iron-sulfur subunit [Candidatus Poribacteria bacterium]